MKKLYIVRGETGQWEDYCHWFVRAFISKRKAKQYRNKTQVENDKLYAGAGWEENKFDYPKNIGNKYDVRAMFDYTGTKYNIVTLDFDDEE